MESLALMIRLLGGGEKIAMHTMLDRVCSRQDPPEADSGGMVTNKSYGYS